MCIRDSWYRGNPEQMQNLEMGVLEDQVVDHIISKAAIEDVVADYDSVISGAAIAPPETQGEAEAEAEAEAEGESKPD